MATSNLSKPVIHGLGAILSTGVLGASIFFGVLPQVQSAEESAMMKEGLTQELNTSQSKLFQLRELTENSDDLYLELSTLQRSLPGQADISGLQRSVVNAMGSGVDILSFNYAGQQSYTSPEAPEVSLRGFDDPFSIDETGRSTSGGNGQGAGEIATEDVIPDIIDEDSQQEEVESSSSLSAVPVIVEVEAQSMEELSDFFNDLHDANRLLLVVKTNISYPESEGSSVQATVHLYGFIND